MAHLTGARTERKINSIEVVSDDSQRVLRFTVNASGTVSIASRDAIESDWDAKTFATVDKDDGAIIATIFNGGTTPSYGPIGKRIEEVVVGSHSLPAPEEVKSLMDGDCTPLDIERAKAANLKEERELVQLQLERDHALDRHTTADVPGCPACDRKVLPSRGYGDDTDSQPVANDTLDDIPF